MVFVFGASIALLHAHGGNHSGSGNGHQITVHFLNTGVQPGARARIRIQENHGIFLIRIQHAAPGTYDVVLDGGIVDMITVRNNGNGLIVRRLASSTRQRNGNIPTASYDPRGSEVELSLQGVDILMADVPATPAESNARVEIEIDLDDLGVVAGEAEAEFEERRGRMKFEVEIEDIAPGTYDVLVGGVMVGTIEADPGEDEAEIDFDSRPSLGDDDDEDELDLLLTFDPRGQEIVVQQNGVPLFSGTLPLT